MDNQNMNQGNNNGINNSNTTGASIPLNVNDVNNNSNVNPVIGVSAPVINNTSTQTSLNNQINSISNMNPTGVNPTFNPIKEEINNTIPVVEEKKEDKIEVIDNINITPSFIKPVEEKKQDPNELLNAVPKPDMLLSTPTTNMISSDDLLEDFVGPNYEKISKRVQNYSAFFFSSFYFLYRKMYLYGIMIAIIETLVPLLLLLVFPALSFTFILIFNIVLCLTFNKMYIKYSKGKIDQIKEKNKSKSISELTKICQRKGGTSIIGALVFNIVTSVIVSVILILSIPSFFTIIAAKIFVNNAVVVDDNSDENIDNEDSNKYNGVINYDTNVIVLNNIEMGYLQIFKPDVLNNDNVLHYNFQTIEGVDGTSCKFSLGVVKGYDSSSILISEMAKYHGINEPTINTTSNGLTWNSFKKESDLTSVQYDAYSYNNQVYLLEYERESNSNKQLCEAFHNGVLNSIKFK